MTKEEFKVLLQEKVLPLFTGSEIIGEEESSSRDYEVAQGARGTVLVKATRADEYRFVVKRIQPFKMFEVSLLKNVIEKLVQISTLDIGAEYLENLQRTAIESAICKNMSETASSTILSVISSLVNWSTRTYEGKKLDFGIIVDETSESEVDGLNYIKVADDDFFALLSDGTKSCIELDKNGNLVGYVAIERVRLAPTLSPLDFINVARYCCNGKIGICLTGNGDLLLFKNRELLFACRHGVWATYCHEEIIGLLSNRSSHTAKDIRKAIYFTALDCSFSYTGGCIAYINRDKCNMALSHINVLDIISEKHYNMKRNQFLQENVKFHSIPEREVFGHEYDELLSESYFTKSRAINKIIAGKKFHELSRKLREDIVAMDGATIIDYDGTIIATGAIVKIEAGSTGGGRLAATKTLAKYGVAIKISVDGTIESYSLDKKQNKSKKLFSVG